LDFREPLCYAVAGLGGDQTGCLAGKRSGKQLLDFRAFFIGQRVGLVDENPVRFVHLEFHNVQRVGIDVTGRFSQHFGESVRIDEHRQRRDVPFGMKLFERIDNRCGKVGATADRLANDRVYPLVNERLDGVDEAVEVTTKATSGQFGNAFADTG